MKADGTDGGCPNIVRRALRAGQKFSGIYRRAEGWGAGRVVVGTEFVYRRMMPQSLANILVHLVFSTKNRAPLLADEWRNDLHGYIGGIVRRCGGELIAANSVADHIHLLFPLPRTVSVAIW